MPSLIPPLTAVFLASLVTLVMFPIRKQALANGCTCGIHETLRFMHGGAGLAVLLSTTGFAVGLTVRLS